jgi:branched-chain amino acid transport system substrate-binding protein
MGASRRFLLVFTMLLMALAVGLSACGSDDDGDAGDGTPEATDDGGGNGDEPTDTPEQALTKEQILEKDPSITQRAEVEWGWMFEESGPLAGFGVPTGDGVKMAVEEINAAGGFQVGDTIYTITLNEQDTRSEVNNTVAVATSMIRDDGLKIIWGPAAVGDPETTPLTQQNGVLHICPCPSREVTALSSVEQVERQSKLAFQTLPAPSKFLPPGAQDLSQEHPEYESFVTICTDSETGRTFCENFKNAYEGAGFELVGEAFTPIGTTDFRPFLTDLRRNDPDVVLNFLDAGPEQFNLLRQSWELDIGEYYIGVAVPYDLFEALVGEGIRDKIVSAGAAPRTHAIYTSDEAEAFFEEKYRPYAGGELPPAAFGALLTYDPVFMLVAAMQKAGTVDDVQAIAEALETIHYNGTGEDNYFFDKRHIMVSGNDSCIITQGAYEGCQHHAPPPEPE